MHALVLALQLFAAGDAMVIDTKFMAEGQEVVNEADGTTVTVVRDGHTRHALVQRDGATQRVAVTWNGSQLTVAKSKAKGQRVLTPAVQRVIDGVPVEVFTPDPLRDWGRSSLLLQRD